MTQAFVYKWTHLPTLNWYVGSRTAKNCHPDDGYICSSRVVKPLIEEHPNEWVRTIVGVGTVDEMRKLETEILQLFNAKSDPRSFNGHNNMGDWMCQGWPLGKPRNKTWNKGIPRTQEVKDAVSKANTGKEAWNKNKTLSDEHKLNVKIARSKQTNVGHDKTMYTCIHCSQVIRSKSNLLQHTRAKHSEANKS